MTIVTDTARDRLVRAKDASRQIGLLADAEKSALLRDMAEAIVREADAIVVAEVYLTHHAGAVAPQAEIEEVRWVDPANPGEMELAPLTRHHIFPAYLRLRDQAWRATR